MAIKENRKVITSKFTDSISNEQKKIEMGRDCGEMFFRWTSHSDWSRSAGQMAEYKKSCQKRHY